MPKRHDKITKSVNYDYYWDILFCTVPLLAVSCFYYGARPLLMMAAGLLTAYVADCVVTPLHAAGYRAHEPSSEAFAALIVLMMPASAPYYMVVTATIIAVLVKEAFGGEGHYPFHPAAVGLVAATLAWPRDMSSYPAPGTVLALFSSTGVVLTQGSNTTLSAGGLPSDSTINLLTGNVAGPLGCCAILVIVACGLYLLVRGHMQLSTFVPYLAVCVLVPWLLPNLNELPALSAPWEYVRQRIYLEKYILLSGQHAVWRDIPGVRAGGAAQPLEQPFDLRPVPGRQWQRRSAITAYTKPAYALPLYWLVLSPNGWTAWPSAQKGSDSCGRRKSALPNTENRKNSNKKPTLQEHSQTVIIPQLTPEMLEQARPRRRAGQNRRADRAGSPGRRPGGAESGRKQAGSTYGRKAQNGPARQ